VWIASRGGKELRSQQWRLRRIDAIAGLWGSLVERVSQDCTSRTRSRLRHARAHLRAIGGTSLGGGRFGECSEQAEQLQVGDVLDDYRRGQVGDVLFEGFPPLILTSTSAKSGTRREKLIGNFDIDDKIYVGGSAAGSAASPETLRRPHHTRVR
jgi:hypothetical protein